jgi:hypothetical protein
VIPAGIFSLRCRGTNSSAQARLASVANAGARISVPARIAARAPMISIEHFGPQPIAQRIALFRPVEGDAPNPRPRLVGENS